MASKGNNFLMEGLELFAILKRWPSKGESKPVLPLTLKDDEMRSIEDEMAEQKRKFEQMLEGKDAQIHEGQKRLKTMEGQVIAFQEYLIHKDNDISELQKENNKLVSKLIRSEQNKRDTNKELCDVRDKLNYAEAKIKQRDNQIHQLKMKQTELVSTLKQTEREKANFYYHFLTIRKQLHDTEGKLIEVREQKREAEAEKHDVLRRPLTPKDVEMKNIEVKMAEQKRKFEQMLEGKDAQIEESQEMLNTMEGQVIAFQQIVTQKDNYISELKKENSELLSKLKRSEQNFRDTNKELSDVRDIKNDAEAKTKQRNNQIHQLHMKQKELVSTLEQTESERKNVFDDLLIAKKKASRH